METSSPPSSAAFESGFYHNDMSRPGLDEHSYVVAEKGCAIRVEFTTALVSAALAQRILELITAEMQDAQPVIERVLSLIS